MHALTIMSNHVHMVATPPDAGSLAMFVRLLAQRYATSRNVMRGASGKLFEERYFSRPLPDVADVALVIPYVDLNPVRAGKVIDGCDYRWSTFALHAGAPDRSRIPVELWQPSAWYLTLGASASARAAAYLEHVQVALQHGDQMEAPAKIAAIEALSNRRYTMRLERPDRSSAL